MEYHLTLPGNIPAVFLHRFPGRTRPLPAPRGTIDLILFLLPRVLIYSNQVADSSELETPTPVPASSELTSPAPAGPSPQNGLVPKKGRAPTVASPSSPG